MRYKVTIRDTLDREYSREFETEKECFDFANCEGDHVVDFQIEDEEGNIFRNFYTPIFIRR